MPRIAFVCCVVLALCLNFGCSRRRKNVETEDWVMTNPVKRQAEPVRNWLQSIKARDVELFKTVFSASLLPHFEKQGWGRMLGVYTTLWTEKLGDFDIDQLSFDFKSYALDGLQSGEVTVKRGTQTYPPIKVIFEEGVWKVNEL